MTELRHGFTTGSCAAAASKAAIYMLLSGKEKQTISITTPSGKVFQTEVLDITKGADYVQCAVKKDAGDDPDVTDGCLIYAKVRCCDLESAKNEADLKTIPVGGEAGEGDALEHTTVVIDGGVGVGRVTKEGLDQPVGNAAINHVPREMIEKEVTEVAELFDYGGTIEVIISVPDGEELAAQTFNERFGIVGGISIIGTTGIVEPMSSDALLETIRIELNQHRLAGEKSIIISPGNYGQDYMRETYGYDLDKAVKCSNFVGDTLDMLLELGFERLLFVGHIGKLAKVAGGMMNTHSMYGDHRMEIISEAAKDEGASSELIDSIMDCVATEAAVGLLDKAGIKDIVMNRLLKQIVAHMSSRVDGKVKIDCILYGNEYGALAKTPEADAWFL